MKKQLLVDLSSLKNIYSGLGQVALSYGDYFKNNYNPKTAPYTLTLLLPKKFFGVFGEDLKYISSTNLLRKHCRWLFPKFDLWHSIHQLSRFRPVYSTTKYILTIHDLNHFYEKTGRSKTRRHKKIQRKISQADEIVCISKFTKWDVENKLELKGKRCKVIYNMVRSLDDKVAVKPDFHVQEPFFFTIGKIIQKKNFHVLLDLMKLIPDKHLYIVGKGANRKDNTYAMEIKRKIQEENISNVTLQGPVSHEEKVWMYQHCLAFFFPSLLEGFGLPVIEAMQFGKPVFSSQETSLKEIGGEYAYFWKNFDPLEMNKLVEDNLEGFYSRKELAEKEKEYASSFSYEKHFEEYEKIYSTI